jgi:hypothetical protein
MKYGRCECGAKPVKVLTITVGQHQTTRYPEAGNATLPLCADCLELEREQEDLRYGDRDTRSHFRTYYGG